MLQKIFAIVIFIFISACGFKPLYYDNSNYETLSSIKIGTITTGENPGKIHLAFRKALENMLYFAGESNEKKHLLNINIQKINTGFGTQRNTVDTRMIINIVANFHLQEIATGNKILQENVYSYDSFEITKSPYSTLVSEEESVVRMAKAMVDEIKIRIIAHLSSKKTDALASKDLWRFYQSALSNDNDSLLSCRTELTSTD